MTRGLHTFWRERGGATLPLIALALPVMAGLGLGAVEVSDLTATRTGLQGNIDMAALKGARELGTDRSAATAERARQAADAASARYVPRWSISTTATFDPKANAVTVTQTATRPTVLTALLPSAVLNVTVTATGTLQGSKTLCVLGAQSTGLAAVTLSASSQLSAPNCLVQSNGTISVGGAAKIQAGSVRSVGAATGNIAPAPVTDAPAIADPFASIPIDVPARCDDTIVTAPGGTTTLNPGVHCGALGLTSGKIVLNPGEHYFVGDGLTLLGNAEIVGEDVVLIFKGQVLFNIAGNAKVSLDGRKSGPFAGFVLVSDRSLATDFSVSTNNAQRLQGTVYLPNARLLVSGNNNRVADQSPWTVVVARALSVVGSANLVINADYYTATVPLPQAIGTKGPVLSN